jgi:NAD(P)-dependent dehydrogenase (short-subunit alcohol dehydrogenase family)
MSQLDGQTVVVIGGSAGMGLATAHLARAEGAEVVITGRDRGRLEGAAADVGARSSAAFDELPGGIDHIMLTAGRPTYSRLLDLDGDRTREALGERIVPALEVARAGAPKMSAGGSLILIGGTGAHKISREIGVGSAAVAGMAAFTATLALELAPVRVNLINPGFVDTGLSARVLGDGLEARRQELRRTLPIGRVIEPTDVAALAVHLMTNTAITGAGFDIDGGQQFVEQPNDPDLPRPDKFTQICRPEEM